MMTDATADTRKRVIFLEEFQCFPVVPLVDKGNVALNADMGRTGSFARRCSALTDAEGSGNRLGILFENRFPIR